MKQRERKKNAKTNGTKNWFFEEISKTDKHSRKIKKKLKKKERTQINKIRDKKAEVTTDTTKIQRIIKYYYRQLYANKMDNLEETYKFLIKVLSPKTQPGRQRKYEQTDHKH